jgi:hypothetical protein
MLTLLMGIYKSRGSDQLRFRNTRNKFHEFLLRNSEAVRTDSHADTRTARPSHQPIFIFADHDGRAI